MNSKQRRKDRKLWKYHVDVAGSYAEFGYRHEEEQHYLAMFNWCRAQFGDNVVRCGWRDRNWGQRWEFNDSKKAALFALRWAGK